MPASAIVCTLPTRWEAILIFPADLDASGGDSIVPIDNYHLHLILDLYSRKIVGWEVHDSSDHAVHLVRRTALVEAIAALAHKPVLTTPTPSRCSAPPSMFALLFNISAIFGTGRSAPRCHRPMNNATSTNTVIHMVSATSITTGRQPNEASA